MNETKNKILINYYCGNLKHDCSYRYIENNINYCQQLGMCEYQILDLEEIKHGMVISNNIDSRNNTKYL